MDYFPVRKSLLKKRVKRKKRKKIIGFVQSCQRHCKKWKFQISVISLSSSHFFLFNLYFSNSGEKVGKEQKEESR